MNHEGYHDIGTMLKNKEWWNFTFFSRRESLVFSYTMLKSKIRDHLTCSLWNFKKDETINLDFDSKIDAEQGDRTDLYAEGKWGKSSVKGRYEDGGWELKIKNPEFSADLFYSPESSQKIIENFWDEQFKCELYAKNTVTGTLDAFGRTYDINTQGCREHTFCDFPRNTSWNWVLALHDEYSIVVSRGDYAGYDYKYAVMFSDGRWLDLDENVDFEVDEDHILKTCKVTSSDIDLKVYPIRHRYTHKKIWMGLLVNAHYWELATRITGSVTISHRKMPIDTYGIMTRSRMKW
ncbi:MAG: hypothetical protein PVF58_16780 [Candidatus Methanofastidiosia archaeon]|jgi:hypothetical protein